MLAISNVPDVQQRLPASSNLIATFYNASGLNKIFFYTTRNNNLIWSRPVYGIRTLKSVERVGNVKKKQLNEISGLTSGQLHFKFSRKAIRNGASLFGAKEGKNINKKEKSFDDSMSLKETNHLKRIEVSIGES
ncbi:CLUMA_CG015473, isoform A [Clunio marinus]|uniref:CLUMA_CG015473, isoform A n=1 Tax=Clunio marinus TaxID=568069 RepID=A0A1J1IQL2_9DIPT|nr:CLUMA_CG015473, isoform A [Clunio marinus]